MNNLSGSFHLIQCNLQWWGLISYHDLLFQIFPDFFFFCYNFMTFILVINIYSITIAKMLKNLHKSVWILLKKKRKKTHLIIYTGSSKVMYF